MPATAQPGLHLREATPEDRDAVCALLAEVAAQTAGEAHHSPPALADPAAHDWLYWNNPYGPPANLVWEEDGRIIAHAGMYRLTGLVEGRTVRVGRTAHAVTARAYRGRGLFGALARRQREHLGVDVDLLVALPTAAAVPGLEGAGVAQQDRAQRWFRPIEDEFRDLGRVPRPLAATMTRVAFGPRPTGTGTPMEGVPEGLDDLATATTDDGVRCDAQWWRWRFVDHPVHTYQRYVTTDTSGRVTAALAARPDRYFGADFLQILHWQAIDAEHAAGVLGTALADSKGCVAATLLATEGSQVAEWARDNGMRRLPSLIDDTSGQIAIASDPQAGAMLPNRHWSVSLASHHDR